MTRARAPRLKPVRGFAFRTPLLPLAELVAWSEGLAGPHNGSAEALAGDVDLLRARLRALLDRPEVRDALFVASPDLDASLATWCCAPDTPSGRKVEHTLTRYLARMTSRATPFGLFSGVSVGRVGSTTHLHVVGRHRYRRSTRLDNDYLFALTAALGADPAMRKTLRWVPNSSLYRAAGRLRYAQARLRERDRTYHLVAVECNDPLLRTLERATTGGRRSDLAAALVDDDPEIEREEAEAFIDELIDSQILVCALDVAVTGQPPVQGVIDALDEHAPGHAAAMHLRRAQKAIEAIDSAGLGATPDAYCHVAQQLEPLPQQIDMRRLFQVDMVKPAPHATLHSAVVDEVVRGIALLHRLARRQDDDAMSSFVEAFERRYGTREVPLTQALDEEVGIGFQASRAPGAGASPLLAGLAFPMPGSLRQTFDRREVHLLARLEALWRRGDHELRLTRDDLEVMSADDPSPLPDAFGVMVEIAARSAQEVDQGRFQVLLGATSGPCGARLTGRFCHASPELEALVRAHIHDEEALVPDAVFAEIVHLPEGRIGNILCRPVLRDYEIPFLGRSGAPRDRQIPVQDLLLSVRGREIVLRSRRLGRRVIPRMSTAHNFGWRSLGIYRFLSSLQSHGVTGVVWNWGALNNAPFLPRVTHGRLVFARARWRLDAEELGTLATAARGAKKADTREAIAALRARVFAAMAGLREQRKLPRWVLLAGGDNELAVDLDNVLCVDSFVQQVKSRQQVNLYEMFPGPDDLIATAPGGTFRHEVVLAFVRDTAADPTKTALPRRAQAAAPVRRTFPIGSEWLYAKIYTGTATADDILREVVAPVSRELVASGAATSWFFIRYGDPDWHLRVRFRGSPPRLRDEVLPALHDALRPVERDGLVWRIVLDTYAREVERYGGPEGIEPSEALFSADSDAVLEIVEHLRGDEGADARWRLGVRGAHLLMEDMGWGIEQMHPLMTRLRDGFGREFAADAAFWKQLGARFRAECDALIELVTPNAQRDAASWLAPGFAALVRRSQRQRALIGTLHERRLTVPQSELVASYIHMHLNRLLRSEQRAHELVVYELMRRTYASLRARAP